MSSLLLIFPEQHTKKDETNISPSSSSTINFFGVFEATRECPCYLTHLATFGKEPSWAKSLCRVSVRGTSVEFAGQVASFLFVTSSVRCFVPVAADLALEKKKYLKNNSVFPRTVFRLPHQEIEKKRKKTQSGADRFVCSDLHVTSKSVWKYVPGRVICCHDYRHPLFLSFLFFFFFG